MAITTKSYQSLSPSSRRAWIEISGFMPSCLPISVALLAEGVDRNASCSFLNMVHRSSPSSRRAWIEIRSKSCWKKMPEASPSSRRAWIV